MKQNLFWTAIYNILAIPVATGVFYTPLGWSLRPEIAAHHTGTSKNIVAPCHTGTSNFILLAVVKI